MARPKPLTGRELKLVELYTANPDQPMRTVMIAAGYSENYANVHAGRVFQSPKIKEAIALKMAPVLAKLEVTREKIVRRVAEKFFANDATPNEIARLGKLLAEMTPGALVPIQVGVIGMTLEQFMEQAHAQANDDR